MDWKSERAVQEKVWDSKKKNKRKRHEDWSVPMEEHSVSVCIWRLLPDFQLIMSFLPRKCLLPHQLVPCSWPHPVNGSICPQWYHLQWSLPSVCTTMSVRLPSCLSCLFRQSHLFYTVVQSYSYTVVQSYIHIFTHSYIHGYITYTQHHSYMIALVTLILVWPYLFSLVLTQTISGSFFIETACKYNLFSQKCHPRYVGSRDVTPHVPSK